MYCAVYYAQCLFYICYIEYFTYFFFVIFFLVGTLCIFAVWIITVSSLIHDYIIFQTSQKTDEDRKKEAEAFKSQANERFGGKIWCTNAVSDIWSMEYKQITILLSQWWLAYFADPIRYALLWWDWNCWKFEATASTAGGRLKKVDLAQPPGGGAIASPRTAG